MQALPEHAAPAKCAAPTMSENTSEYFEEWLDSLDEGWWDDAADACGILSSLADAYAAGFAKARGNGRSLLIS